MSTRKKIPLIDASAELAVTGTVTLTGSGSAVITFPSVSCSFANPGTSGNVMTSNGTDWVSEELPSFYPVGTIYSNKTNSANPSTYLPGQAGTTWTALSGVVVVGKAASGTFSTAGATGGSETHTLSVTEMPSHSHLTPGVTTPTGTGGILRNSSGTFTGGSVVNIGSDTIGSGTAHNNLQPYVVAYVWERTA